MMKNPRFLTWPKLVLIPDPPPDMAKTGAQLLSWTSLSKEVFPLLSEAEAGSCKASPERIRKKLGKPNMAAWKEA
ncbi:hypothetical protein OIU85_010608 [Salix viminalis]|uniref:Uncharacterized protein n=1 Tax=Salix viminalis TaxID=40686 RepID=A0A9Q0NX77_SALVM|nr:hypothetical protein OIU85_010608 [Salix viminalis]